MDPAWLTPEYNTKARALIIAIREVFAAVPPPTEQEMNAWRHLKRDYEKSVLRRMAPGHDVAHLGGLSYDSLNLLGPHELRYVIGAYLIGSIDPGDPQFRPSVDDPTVAGLTGFLAGDRDFEDYLNRFAAMSLHELRLIADTLRLIMVRADDCAAKARIALARFWDRFPPLPEQ